MIFLGLLNIVFIKIPSIIIFINICLLSKNKSLWVSRLFCIFFVNYFCLAIIPEINEKFTTFPTNKSQKACFATMKNFGYAVEMYNMDNNTPMTSLDISVLLKGNYLKDNSEKLTKECDYYSEGDLSKDGYICCRKHGSIIQLKQEEDERQKRIKEKQESLLYKIQNYSSPYDRYIIEIIKSLIDVLNYICIIPLMGPVLQLIVFFATFVLGFTLRLTNLTYLIISIITLLVLISDYRKITR